MALQGKIKISSVNNLSDARYVAGMGVEYLGFDVDPLSDSRISATDFAAITGWVSGVQLVGQVDAVSLSELDSLLAEYPLDLIEFTDPTAVTGDFPKPFALHLRPSNLNQLEEILSQYEQAQYFLIDTSTLTAGSWEATLKVWVKSYPILVGGDLNQRQALDWLASGALGIELKGGDEIKPGYKDFDDLADILEALEIDDAY